MYKYSPVEIRQMQDMAALLPNETDAMSLETTITNISYA